MAVPKSDKIEDLRAKVLSLDEEELWKLVCSLFPEAAEESLEDIYDALLSTSRKDGPGIPADEVFAEEDKIRGQSYSS